MSLLGQLGIVLLIKSSCILCFYFKLRVCCISFRKDLVCAWYGFCGRKFETCMLVAADVAKCHIVIGVCDDLI